MLTFEAMYSSTATMYLMDALGRTVWQSGALIHAGGNVQDISYPLCIGRSLLFCVIHRLWSGNVSNSNQSLSINRAERSIFKL